MEFEVYYTRKVTADSFFDAVELVQSNLDDVEEVVSVCPYVEEEEDLMIEKK